MEQTKKLVIIEPGQTEKNYWRDIWNFRELFYILSWRDLKVRYKQTVLGVVWAVLRPLLTMTIFTVIFGRAAGLKADDPSVPYALFVFAGLLPWQFFSSSLTESGNSLIQNANLISKVYFPRIIVPSSSIITSLVDFAISFGLFVLLFVLYQFVPSWRIIFLPLFVLLTFILALGVGLFLTAMNVKYRDFKYIIPFIVQFGLFVSPVGFGSKHLFSKLPYWASFIFSLNPMMGIIDGFRWCCFEKSSLDIHALAMSTGITLFFAFIGVRQFRKMEKSFADII